MERRQLKSRREKEGIVKINYNNMIIADKEWKIKGTLEATRN